tara:strand:+ start:206 stop:598 length:393 start_codon:yes stop_codon:yes gene_type:complete
MKKTILSVALLLGSYATKAQTEYIDIAKVGMLGTSTMAVYSDDWENDLTLHRLNKLSKRDHYHYVKYTNLGNDKVVLTLSDDPGDTRNICIKENGELVKPCYDVDSFATSYEFTSDAHEFKIYISRTNKK